MKILVVAPWVPGLRRPRSLGLIEMLNRSHEVVVVCAVWGGKQDPDVSTLASRVKVVPVTLSTLRARFRTLLGLFGRRPIQQRYVEDRSFIRAIRHQLDAFRPDLVYFNVLRGAGLRRVSGSLPTIVDLDEFRSDYYRQSLARGRSTFWRAVSRIELSRTVREEEAIVRDAQVVLVSSPADVPNRPENVVLVRSPHALSRVSTSHHGEESTRPTVLFVGRLSYSANIQGLTWFVREVWPLVAAAVPGSVLRIVGADAGREIRELKVGGVEYVGPVPDVTHEYVCATVNIVPIWLATGVQMKLIEALTVGTPTVATPLVASLAGVADGAECRVADSPSEWAKAVIDLLRDPRERKRLGAGGLRWAAANYSPEGIAAALDDAFTRLQIRSAANGQYGADLGGHPLSS